MRPNNVFGYENDSVLTFLILSKSPLGFVGPGNGAFEELISEIGDCNQDGAALYGRDLQGLS